MKILQYYIKRTEFWIRIFGYGITGKNLKHHSLMFSERNGYVKTLKIFGWSFKWLKPYKI